MSPSTSSNASGLDSQATQQSRGQPAASKVDEETVQTAINTYKAGQNRMREAQKTLKSLMECLHQEDIADLVEPKEADPNTSIISEVFRDGFTYDDENGYKFAGPPKSTTFEYSDRLSRICGAYRRFGPEYDGLADQLDDRITTQAAALALAQGNDVNRTLLCRHVENVLKKMDPSYVPDPSCADLQSLHDTCQLYQDRGGSKDLLTRARSYLEIWKAKEEIAAAEEAMTEATEVLQRAGISLKRG